LKGTPIFHRTSLGSRRSETSPDGNRIIVTVNTHRLGETLGVVLLDPEEEAGISLGIGSPGHTERIGTFIRSQNFLMGLGPVDKLDENVGVHVSSRTGGLIGFYRGLGHGGMGRRCLPIGTASN
jgi:hypothetical protein